MNRIDLKDALPGRCRELRAIFLRSLALQASWNPQRLQHLGLLTTLLPWLRLQRPTREETRRFCRDHFHNFNTNPYLANFLIGGLIRLESESRQAGGGYVRTIHSFKTSLGRALASLGDQLFWLGLQPGLLILAAMIGLTAPAPLVLVPFVVFTGFQLVLRLRALDAGYRLGLDIVDLLGAPIWHRAILVCKRTGAVLTGVFAAYVTWHVVGIAGDPDGKAVAFGILTTAVIALVLRRRAPGEYLLLVLLPLALVLTYL